MIPSAFNNKFDEWWSQKRFIFPSPLNEGNLSLIAWEIMRLLVNQQLIPLPIKPKSIFLTKLLRKTSSQCCNFTALSSFPTLKYNDLKRISESANQCSVSRIYLSKNETVFKILKEKHLEQIAINLIRKCRNI